MKKIIRFIWVLALFSCNQKTATKETKTTESDTKLIEQTNTGKQKPETFTYKEGDTTYIMQKYFMVFLKKGPQRDQDSLTLANLQKQHLAHLEKLGLAGKISIAGPFEGNSEISGMVIYNTPDFKEADSLAKSDPAVKAGRLIVETHPFWAAKGSTLK